MRASINTSRLLVAPIRDKVGQHSINANELLYEMKEDKHGTKNCQQRTTTTTTTTTVTATTATTTATTRNKNVAIKIGIENKLGDLNSSKYEYRLYILPVMIKWRPAMTCGDLEKAN